MAPIRDKNIHDDVTSRTSGQERAGEGSGPACGLRICDFSAPLIPVTKGLSRSLRVVFPAGQADGSFLAGGRACSN
jgi:hypothetical protein